MIASTACSTGGKRTPIQDLLVVPVPFCRGSLELEQGPGLLPHTSSSRYCLLASSYHPKKFRKCTARGTPESMVVSLSEFQVL